MTETWWCFLKREGCPNEPSIVLEGDHLCLQFCEEHRGRGLEIVGPGAVQEMTVAEFRGRLESGDIQRLGAPFNE